MERQVKSKKRVATFGEVYTARKQINDMLALIPDTTLTTTYMEPACGNGNFLVAILQRKLALIPRSISSHICVLELFKAISSIYGVDIQLDNVLESRERLMQQICDYCRQVNILLDPSHEAFLQLIISHNIVYGDTLTAEGVHGPLIFSEWIIESDQVIRKDYLFSDMLQNKGVSNKCINERIYHPKQQDVA